MSRKLLIGVGVLVVVLGVLTAGAALMSQSTTMNTPATQPLPTGLVHITGTSSPEFALPVEIADTNAARVEGLSDRATICGASMSEGCTGAAQGMLFVFDTPGEYGFWMKDMRFSLDLLFADAHGTITTIYRDVSPSTYTAQNPQASQIFYPAAPSKYVLEVPANFAATHSIAVGSQLQLQ